MGGYRAPARLVRNRGAAVPLKAPDAAPHPFKREIIRFVREYDKSRPRSMQKHLGPSEIGSPCTRQLGMKLAGVEPCNETADPWFPIIGTAVHAWLATALDWYQYNRLGCTPDNPRFIIEQRVHAESEGGYSTSGSTDVYDTLHDRVVDWKIVGATTMKKVRAGTTPAEQAGPQYTVQGMTYGKGWEQRGFTPQSVLICFLPRSNFLDKMQLVEIPYDRSIADRAQLRLAAIDQARKVIEPHLLPAGGCTVWCPFYRPGVPLGPTSCPGHGDAKDD